MRYHFLSRVHTHLSTTVTIGDQVSSTCRAASPMEEHTSLSYVGAVLDESTFAVLSLQAHETSPDLGPASHDGEHNPSLPLSGQTRTLGMLGSCLRKPLRQWYDRCDCSCEHDQKPVGGGSYPVQNMPFNATALFEISLTSVLLRLRGPFMIDSYT